MADDQAQRGNSTPEAADTPIANILESPTSVDYTALDVASAIRTEGSASGAPQIDLTSPAPALDWTRYWPVPIFGAAYLLHTQFRRYSPRRLPPLTPMKPTEIYATATAYMLWVNERIHLEQEAIRDRDLCTIHVAVQALRTSITLDMERLKRVEHLKNTKAYDAVSPAPSAGLFSRLAWRYHTTGYDPVAFSVATAIIMGTGESYLKQDPRRVRREDLAILVAYLANAVTASVPGAENTFKGINQKKCAIGLGVATPFAMLARWARRSYLFYSLNVVQRLLLYGTIFPEVMVAHGRVYLPTTMHDQHAVAELCRAILPGLDKIVDELMEGNVDIFVPW